MILARVITDRYGGCVNCMINVACCSPSVIELEDAAVLDETVGNVDLAGRGEHKKH